MPPAPTWPQFRELRFSAGGYPLTRHVSQRLGAALAYGGMRLGTSAAALTLSGLALNVAASATYALAPPGMASWLAALLLLQLAYGFDCADGQLARATQRASAFGAWLDLACDYVRCTLLAFGVLLALARLHGVPLEVAAAASALLLSGTVVGAHTGMAMRGAPRAGPDVAAGPIKTAARVLIDTPFLLAVLCVLRDAPGALALAAAGFGLAELGIAAAVASRRLPR
jgi:phosphatidylglycerophosphate synthase